MIDKKKMTERLFLLLRQAQEEGCDNLYKQAEYLTEQGVFAPRHASGDGSHPDRERLIGLLEVMDAHPEKTCPRYGTGDTCFNNCPYNTKDGYVCDVFAKRADFMLQQGVKFPIREEK